MVENTNGGGKQPPRKSFLYYYGLVMLIVMLLNIFLFPSMMDRTQQVRFDQFSDQLKEDNVDEVYVTTNNEIVYTLKNDNKNTAWNVTYKTGEIPGVNLYDLLDGKDVKYSAEINTQASPLLNFLLTWILPLVLFVGIGQLMGRSLMKRMGGGPGNAMTFGKSNAKIYAESETGITFADVAGEEEAKDALKEIVDFLHKPEKYSEEPVKRCWRRPLPGKHTFRSSRSPVRNLLRCLSAWVRRRCVIYLNRPMKKRRVSYLSTRSIRLVRSVTAPAWAAMTSASRR